MNPAQVDCWLECTRLTFASGQSAEARDSFRQVRTLAPLENYHRPDQELEVVQAELSAAVLG